MRVGDAVRTALTLVAFAATLVPTMMVTGVALLATGAAGTRRARQGCDRKTILVSGARMSKALALARCFHAAGHRVVMTEVERYWCAPHRFSRAVAAFHLLPDVDTPAYADALRALIEREAVDLYVPVTSPKGALVDSAIKASLPARCEMLHVGIDLMGKVDDKGGFACAAAALGLDVPRTFRITDPEQLAAIDWEQVDDGFILKSVEYDAVARLDLTRLPLATPEATIAFARTLPIGPDRPWVLQEFVEGTEYCTHGTFRNGELRVHCCCESSPFQVNYDHVDKPAIEQWVRTFARGLGLTGQASFDFIETGSGRLVAIECNPRTHSAITLLDGDPRVAAAYVDDRSLPAPVRPVRGGRPTYWLYHELWRLVGAASWRDAAKRLSVIVRGRDAVFSWHDPLPFLMLHHWHIPVLLLRSMRERRGWLRIDFNIGKLVQAGGD